MTLERIGDQLRAQGVVRDGGHQPLDARIVERAVKVCKAAAKVSREVTALVGEVRRVRGEEDQDWGALVAGMEETRGTRRENMRVKREAQRRKMEQLRARVEMMRHRQQGGGNNGNWGLRRKERELQRLQERVAGQEDMDRREIREEEEGATFLDRLLRE